MKHLLLGLGLILTTSTALAQSPADQRARIHFEAGNSYYERGSFEDAAREFQLSYALSERPELLFNIFSSYEQSGDLAQAESALERYVASNISDERRALAEERLVSLRERMRVESALAEPEEPTEATRETIRDEEPSEGRSGARKAAIALWALGGVGLVDFAAFAALSSSEAGELTCGPSCSDDQVSSLRTYNVLADIGLALGIVGVVAGTVLWVVGKPSPVSVAADNTSASVHFHTAF